MTTYRWSRTRSDLDVGAGTTGRFLSSIPETTSDLAGTEFEGIADLRALPRVEPHPYLTVDKIVPGQDWLVCCSATKPGYSSRSSERVWWTVWVRAERDISDDLSDARADVERATAERDKALARRDELIRQALDQEVPAALIAQDAGVSVPRVYQIRDGRR